MRRRTLEEIQAEVQNGLSPCPDSHCRCLLWTGALDKDGYGRMHAGPAYNSAVSRSYKSSWRVVHRVAWELENGPIPDGLTLDHVRDRGCQHKHCANLAHLELATVRVNILRGGNAAKTHCVRGHPFDQANTCYRPGRGFRLRRTCRTCHRMHVREWRARRSSGGDTEVVAS